MTWPVSAIIRVIAVRKPSPPPREILRGLSPGVGSTFSITRARCALAYWKRKPIQWSAERLAFHLMK